MDNFKSLGQIISIINRYGQIYLAHICKDLDLHGSGQVRIILNLSTKRGGVSQEKLAKDLLVDKATISRMIRPLVDNGMVFRCSNPSDKRAYLIRLTPKAEAAIPEIKKRIQGWTEILSKGLSGEEQDRLFKDLQRMMNNGLEYIRGEKIEE